MRLKIPPTPSPEREAIKEGELYRIITLFGKTFELRYGYYGDSDRPFEPDVIYPDFTKEPVYRDDGTPFATMMQDACRHYRGTESKTDDTTCAECIYFTRCEEWFGVCTCKSRLQNKSDITVEERK